MTEGRPSVFRCPCESTAHGASGFSSPSQTAPPDRRGSSCLSFTHTGKLVGAHLCPACLSHQDIPTHCELGPGLVAIHLRGREWNRIWDFGFQTSLHLVEKLRDTLAWELFQSPAFLFQILWIIDLKQTSSTGSGWSVVMTLERCIVECTDPSSVSDVRCGHLVCGSSFRLRIGRPFLAYIPMLTFPGDLAYMFTCG